MSLFNHTTLAFQPVDDLDGGLGDEIDAERAEGNGFVLDEQLDGTLADAWEAILEDQSHDPSVSFVNEDE